VFTNFNILLLSGGHYVCTPAWNKRADAIDACFKIYRVRRGAAALVAEDGTYALRAGRLYLIDGHRLVAQRCPRRMDVFWIHFAPESMFLERVLSSLPSVVDAGGEAETPSSRWAELLRLFEHPRSRASRPAADAPLAAACRAQGMILQLVGNVLARHWREEPRGPPPSVARFRHVVEFMDARFRSHPSLAELAAEAGMAPSYFHRQFRAAFGVTPHGHLLRRRMELARHLLDESGLRVKEVAAQCGYDNPFYFSRVFRGYFRMSPAAFREGRGRGETRRIST
jgi:AraC-like DNA-binding protein